MVLPSEVKTTRVVALSPFNASEIAHIEHLKPILQVLSFCKWTGFLPITISHSALKTYRVTIAGFLPVFICLAAITLQIVLGLEYVKQVFVERSRLTDILVSLGHYTSSFCSAIIMPRIAVLSKSSLETALITMFKAHSLLGRGKRANSCWPPWLSLLIVCLLMVIFECLWSFHYHAKGNAIAKSPTFTLGTGNMIVGLIVYGLDYFYNALAPWILQVELFVICRALRNCFTCFKKTFAEEMQPGLPSIENSARYMVPTTKKMERFQDLSLNLSKSIIAIDSYFKFSLLLLIASRLIGLLGSLHLLSQKTSSLECVSFNVVLKFLLSMREAVVYVAELVFIIWLGDSVSTAIDNFKLEVLNTKAPTSLDSLEGSYHQWLCNHVTTMKCEITAFGLFPINRRIVPPILGALITYFLIIVQFSKEDHHHTGSLSTNATCS